MNESNSRINDRNRILIFLILMYVLNITLQATSVKNTGLVVIHMGTSGEAYAESIAYKRNWRFLAVSTSVIESIQIKIIREYQKEPFHYLMLIGNNDEIPFRKQVEVRKNNDIRYLMDLGLYGDMNDDGLADLSVGRIPFSDESLLREYFHDLNPKGRTYYFDFFPFVLSGDSKVDSNTVREYTYCKKGLQPVCEGVEVYKNVGANVLIDHYRSAAFIKVASHGSAKAIRLKKGHLYYWDFGDRYLYNRPIILQDGCLTAQCYGIELLKMGASVFMGFYNRSGHVPYWAAIHILLGDSAGDMFRDLYNYYLAFHSTRGYCLHDGVPHQLRLDYYGSILYGDPSVKLQVQPDFQPSVVLEEKSGKVTIRMKSASLIQFYENRFYLNYTGKYVEPTEIFSEIWGKDTIFGTPHKFMMSFPTQLKNIHRIIAKTGDTWLDIPVNETVFLPRIALTKGKEWGFMKILHYSPEIDYDKDLVLDIFENFAFPIITLSASRKIERSWLIKHECGVIHFSVYNPDNVNVSKYIIYRKEQFGAYVECIEILNSEIQNNSFTYADPLPEKNMNYQYKIKAFDENGLSISESMAVEI